MPTELHDTETTGPAREKYWSELTDSAKIERMREIVKTQKRKMDELRTSIDALLKHGHNNQTGKMTLPFPEYIGDPYSEWVPRTTVVAAAREAISKDDVYF